MTTVPLTSLSHGAGCGCKIGPAELGPILAALPPASDPRVLVGAATADDAGVIVLRDDLAIVQSVDFFTPIVDDPYAFGRIAATNALSDVYAMGAKPLSALNLVAFPLAALGADVLGDILRGGGDAAAAAGAAIVGGHTIDDPEPKYGMAVTGTVHPAQVLTNAGGRPGDTLVLTKPLGAGAVATAIKRGVAAAAVVDRAVEVMTTLNDRACEQARAAGAHALTDVTGFGLLGHLHEMCAASGCSAEVWASDIPAIDGVLDLLADGVLAGGTRRNRAWASTFASFADGIGDARQWLAVDAMTSGGLLAALPEERAGEVDGWVIGRLAGGPAGSISVAAGAPGPDR